MEMVLLFHRSILLLPLIPPTIKINKYSLLVSVYTESQKYFFQSHVYMNLYKFACVRVVNKTKLFLFELFSFYFQKYVYSKKERRYKHNLRSI